ncbi:DNA polymerase III subunit gamma/tau [Rheinheimera sp. 4Y26]|uniref:DNA polymerase III subunit gamma/tau n=1 Tax=Rheinheimera sp. 4Y26 TaxID=2977811 RepID=UPI0021B0BD86|nr:DNA polymerase III subunit gamma/tau [Rheinheimera sp. 4Y26]MCT6700100.1 DNA polymerase III subunit gamma/tau [Rheinheimera sp. 4Y26]
MSYQVLARKWRPQNFAQLVGQDHVKAALINALTQNRLHHAYLFTGTRGVGKTTIARIFAKSLNCEKGVTATPCGVCSACVEIDKGYFVDLLEIDAASRTKVEDTRDLLDNVQYAPSRGRYKVYLIDEVHMLSKHSFNALLKTLEEPPPHVKFLLATTDPQKLPITVLSRCLQFSLKALSQSQIKQHLAYILGQEHIQAEDEALALLSRAAKGSLRDSLSLTDQAIAQTNGQIALGPVREMLGLLEQSWAELLLQDVLNRDLAAMQQHLLQLIAQHSQYQSVLDDMLALLHLAALCQFQLNAAELALTESAFVRAVAKTHSAEMIQLYYQLLLSGKKDLAYAPDQRIGLEMALLRAIAFVPASGNEPVQDSARSARAAALSAAGIPAQPPQVQIQQQAAPCHVAIDETAQQQGGHSEAGTQPVDASAQIAAVSAGTVVTEPVGAEHPLASAATQVTSTPAVDPVTASILARRGLSAALPGADDGKKSERQPALVEKQSAATPTTPQALAARVTDDSVSRQEAASLSHVTTPVTAQVQLQSPTAQPEPTLAVIPEVRPLTTAAWVGAAVAEPALTPVPVVAISDSGSAPATDIQVAPSVPLAAEHSLAISNPAEVIDEDSEEAEVFSHHAPAAAMLNNDDPEDEPDPVADSAGGDWAWQQYQAAEETAAVAQSNQNTAAPIRHALLESLQPVADETDFASEAIAQPELSPEALGQVMEFDGVIGAHNFAVRAASQVDSWAARIDQLAIGGLMRLFLLHSSPKLQDNQLVLTVSSSQRHLDNEKNRLTLARVLSASYGMELAVSVEFAEQVPDCPQAIQQRIDEARRLYVQQLLAQDPLVQAMQQQFGAELLADTLSVS